MTSTAQATPQTVAAIDSTVGPTGPFLLATDVSPSSDAAFPLADALADRAKAEIIALSVVAPYARPMYGVDGIVVSMQSETESESLRTSAARAQLTRMVSPMAKWPIIVQTGDPAREIVRMANEIQARLLVVGRGRHSTFDRLVGGESVLRLLQLGDTPVLAVDERLTSPPRRVVIATDFSEFSLYAAQVAMSVVAPDASVWLVHVGPAFDESVPFLRDRGALYAQQTATAFDELRALLPTGHLHIEAVFLTGSAPDQLMQFSTRHNADLVVSATHGYGFMRRMLLGSVAASLVRAAPCSVLIVPGSARTRAVARAQQLPHAQTRTVARESWDAELADFSSRNSGRLCHVEVDQDDLGAQTLGHDLALVGASFDHHDGTVQLMFGASTLRGMHLTHTVLDVSAVDLSTNSAGSDLALRLAHPGGQTLVVLS